MRIRAQQIAGHRADPKMCKVFPLCPQPMGRIHHLGYGHKIFHRLFFSCLKIVCIWNGPDRRDAKPGTQLGHLGRIIAPAYGIVMLEAA